VVHGGGWHRFIALFGPSYVGKTTFLATVATLPDFAVAPLITDRPRRTGEDPNGPAMAIVDAAELDRCTATGSWLVFPSSGYRYALDLTAAERLRANRHVVLGAAPTIVPALRARLPGLLRVLLWPESFPAMQSALLADAGRTLAERRARHALNEEMRAAQQPADLVLSVPRVAGREPLDRLHARLVTRLRMSLSNGSLDRPG